ncbi:MAG TPA: glycosyltransferase family 2 protein [Acidobacteriota bacterium]|jgi:hypothetical protein
MDLSIISVNWNSVEYLRACIASIYEYTVGISFEIIVVDNASPTQDVDLLKQHFRDVRIIKSATNLGFARANNLGFKASSGRYLLFLNPDTELVSPAINVLLERLKSLPAAGIVGCKLLNSDLSVQTSCIQKFPTIVNQVTDIEYLRVRWPNCRLWGIGPLFASHAGPATVEVISGACMMVKREVFEEVAMFSEEYFMYAEDVDLSYKIRRIGLINYYVGEATMIHHGGRSTAGQVPNQRDTIMKSKAILQFCTKTRGRLYGLLYRAAMVLAAMGRLMLIAVMFALGNTVWKREVLQSAAAKWTAVLKWAVGLDDGALGLSSNP